MSEINIDLTKLQAIALFAAKNDIRYYLNGVYVEATTSETRLVATDGAYMAMMRRAQPADFDNAGVSFEKLILPADLIARLKPTKSTVPQIVTLLIEWNGEPGSKPTYTARLWDGSLIPFQPVSGEFPNFRRILPATAATDVPSGLDVEKLAVFAKANKMLGSSRTAGVFNIGYRGEGNAVTIKLPYHPDFSGILMPRKDAFNPMQKLERWPDEGAEVPARGEGSDADEIAESEQ